MMVNLSSVVHNVSHSLIVLTPTVLPIISCPFVFPLSKIFVLFPSRFPRVPSFPHPSLVICLTKVSASWFDFRFAEIVHFCTSYG
jgi:hypothetical protein